MNVFGIRSRLLFAALAPAIFVAALLTTVFLYGRVSDLSQAHHQRADAIARQIATNAEFGLFSGNPSALQALANAAMREPDVSAVTIVDRAGVVVAHAGQPKVKLPSAPGQLSAFGNADWGMEHLIVQPVAASELPGDPLFESRPGAQGRPRVVLGHVALEMSRSSLRKLENALIAVGLLVTFGGLMFGSVLAFRLSRGFSKPLVDLTQTVEHVGRGELYWRVAMEDTGPLRELADGVNRMAARLEQARDELERRIAEATAELRLKKEEAEQANVTKSRFVAAASHDLRQPMHALGLFVDSLRDEVSAQPRARHLVEGMRSSIDAMTAMFDALLDISRLDAGVVAVGRVNFAVSTVLRQIESMFTPLALARGLRFSVVRSSARVCSDPALLERVIQNLVANALTHTRSGGVVVGCRRRPGTLSIQVWDTGPGIAHEHHQDIFKEFVQLGNPERDRGKGLGLGLAIVDRISRMLNHPLRMRSTLGRGSMFATDPPPATDDLEDAGSVAVDPIEEPFSGECVAVLDDDAASVDAMTSLLEGWNCTAIGADSAGSLLRRIAERKAVPEFLICDYRLRDGRNGIQAIEQIRAQLGLKIPAILITGDTAADRLIEAHASGLELLHKPVAPARLRQLLRQLLTPKAVDQDGGEQPPKGDGGRAP